MAKKKTKELDVDFIAIATAFLKMVTGQLDPYTSKKGVIENNGSTEVVLFSPSHIQFAKYGRGPGKRPPLDPILAWVEKKGIVSDQKKQRGIAFAIQGKIGEKGTLNYVPGAPNAIEEAIADNLDAYNQKIGDIMAVEISEDVTDMMTKLFPPTTKIKV